MADSLVHRGPDADGYYVGDGIGLAHRRLSIIDLAGGDQPIGNEDGTVQIVFNGEIYNYPALRSELISRGHTFRTNSDTETIVHLYEELGPDCVNRLRGMFAFAIWDGNRRQLLLARDRLGQKPLYFAQDEEKLLFGSELKAILAFGGVSREIDPEALEDYLTFGCVPGRRSIFSRIRKLRPATNLLLRCSSWTGQEQRYWSLPEEPTVAMTETEWHEAIRDKFMETVDAHRISDVPVGSFLSGGLDSSAVTAVLAGLGNDSVRTFSIGFQEKEFSELPYAETVAQRFHTTHTEAIVTAEAIASLTAMTDYYDEPFADPSAIPTMRVAQLAVEHVKVVLSGDGGDEAFGGYSRYAHDLREAAVRRLIPSLLRTQCIGPLAAVWPKADWLPRVLRAKTLLTNVSLSPAAAYANTLSICRNPLRRQLLSQEMRKSLAGYRPEQQVEHAFGNRENDPLRGMLAADLAMLLPDDFLTKVDRASMAHSLEVRPPLVDHELMELAWTLPSALKVRNGTTKWMFKRVCETWLDRNIIYRPKQGFDMPIDQWLSGPLREFFEDMVLSPSSQLAGYLDLQTVRALFASHCNRTGKHGPLLWAILVLGAWMERYLKESTLDVAHHVVAT